MAAAGCGMPSDMIEKMHSKKMNNAPCCENSDLLPRRPLLERKGWLVAAILIGLAAFIAAIRWHTRDEPLENDIVTYILMGREMAAGGRAYVDVLEFKPPGVFAIWQVVHQTFGSGPNVVYVINVTVATLTMLGCYWASSVRPYGRMGGVLAAGAWALVGGEMRLQANQPNMEVFMNALIVAGFAAWLRIDTGAAAGRARFGWVVLAGMLLSAATLIKHHTILAIAGLAVAWILGGWKDWRTRCRHMTDVAIVAGIIAVTWLALCCYYWSDGRLDDFLSQVMQYALLYGTTDANNNGAVWSGNHGLLHNILYGLSDQLIPNFAVFLGPLLLLMALEPILAPHTKPRDHALLLGGWLLGTALVVMLPGMYFPHYYQLYLPILAVGGAWGIGSVEQFTGSRKRAWLLACGTAIIFLQTILAELRLSSFQWSMAKYESTFVTVCEGAQRIERLLQPGESFYQWGAQPGMYYYANRRPPSGIMAGWTLIQGPMQQKWATKLSSDLQRSAPEMVIVQAGWSIPEEHPFATWLHSHYTAAPSLCFSSMFPEVYVRRGGRLEQEQAASHRQ